MSGRAWATMTFTTEELWMLQLAIVARYLDPSYLPDERLPEVAGSPERERVARRLAYRFAQMDALAVYGDPDEEHREPAQPTEVAG